MVTVKQLIEKLKEFDEDAIITIDARNDDGAAEADLRVDGCDVLDLVDYYNSDEVELI